MGLMDDLFAGADVLVKPPEEQVDDSLPGVLQVVEKNWNQAQEKVRAMFGAEYQVDEIALWFKDMATLNMFASRLVRLDGFEIFGGDSDEVQTRPIHSKYQVEYTFMRTPSEYRLELMTVPYGFSPMHALMSHVARTEPHSSALYVVHASFRVQTEEEYANVVHTLKRTGYEMAMSCTSSYGQFSYFDNYVFDGTPHLKPRLNTRDAVAPQL